MHSNLLASTWVCQKSNRVTVRFLGNELELPPNLSLTFICSSIHIGRHWPGATGSHR